MPRLAPVRMITLLFDISDLWERSNSIRGVWPSRMSLHCKQRKVLAPPVYPARYIDSEDGMGDLQSTCCHCQSCRKFCWMYRIVVIEQSVSRLFCASRCCQPFSVVISFGLCYLEYSDQSYGTPSVPNSLTSWKTFTGINCSASFEVKGRWKVPALFECTKLPSVRQVAVF